MAYYLLPGMKRLTAHEGWLVRVLKGVNSCLQWAFAHQRLLLTTTGIAVLIAVAAAVVLPRSFMPSFNEGTLTVNLLFQPGISLSEVIRVGSIAERLILEVPEAKLVGRRTGRAELDEHAEGVHSIRDRGGSEAVGEAESRGRQRYSRTARGAAGFDQYRPADLAPARSHAVGCTCPDRGQDLRRGPRCAARPGRRLSQTPSEIPGVRRSAGRTASPHSADRDNGQLQEGGAVRSAARPSDRAARAPVQWTVRLAPRRRNSASTSSCVCPTACERRKALPISSSKRRQAGCPCFRSPRSRRPTVRTRSCARTQTAHRRPRQFRWRSATWPRSSPTYDASSPPQSCRTASSQPRGHLPGAGRVDAHHRRPLPRLARLDLRHSLQPVSLRPLRPHHHGQRAARADRLGLRAVVGRPAALGRQHDRLHHADRHRDAQRHPQDQPLHQPRHSRADALRTASSSCAAVSNA